MEAQLACWRAAGGDDALGSQFSERGNAAARSARAALLSRLFAPYEDHFWVCDWLKVFAVRGSGGKVGPHCSRSHHCLAPCVYIGKNVSRTACFVLLLCSTPGNK